MTRKPRETNSEKADKLGSKHCDSIRHGLFQVRFETHGSDYPTEADPSTNLTRQL